MVRKRNLQVGLIAVVLLMTASLAIGNAPTGTTPVATQGLLDGHAFVGKAGLLGYDDGNVVQIDFSDGKFRASSFSDYGFSEAVYTSKEVDGALRFTVAVVSKHAEGGAMYWTGSLRDGVLEGQMRWDHGWESRRYWFRGQSDSARS